MISTYIPKNKVRYQSIHEILTIKEYWNLIREEPVLAISWEQDFSQTYIHKNFHFTLISDKANDLIFLKKSKKSCFLALFDIIFFFKKNPALSHIAKYGP